MSRTELILSLSLLCACGPTVEGAVDDEPVDTGAGIHRCPCDDEDPCNGVELCTGTGACAHGIKPFGLDDHNPCTVDACRKGADGEA
jgi:hypothetical protein